MVPPGGLQWSKFGLWKFQWTTPGGLVSRTGVIFSSEIFPVTGAKDPKYPKIGQKCYFWSVFGQFCDFSEQEPAKTTVKNLISFLECSAAGIYIPVGGPLDPPRGLAITFFPVSSQWTPQGLSAKAWFSPCIPVLRGLRF